MGKQRYWTGNGRTSTTNYNLEPSSSSSTSASAGCMCAVFQLFDFHPLNQHQHQQQHHHPPQPPKPISPPLDDGDRISKGTEAPRNSLESDEEESPLSCTPKQKENGLLHFPKGIVKIKTRSGITMKGSSSPNKENCFSGNSPTTKTPTLVARLMGLDLLPQSISNDSPSTTPRSAYSSPKPKMAGGGSRSLPDTPRTSCETKSNVEIDYYHHRLSLQNPSSYDKENASPSQIVKQIKESVSRKAGLNDITNYARRDQQVILQTKPKKVLSHSSLSSSSLSPKNNSNKSSSKVEAMGTKPKQKVMTRTKTKTRTKVELKKKEEPFVKAAIDTPLNLLKKKSKKTLLSNQLLSFGSVPSTILMKKDPSFSSPIKPTPLQSPPCKRNQGAEETVDNNQPHIPIINHHQYVIKTTAAASAVTAELEYVRQLLLRRTSTSSSSVFLEYNNNNNVSVPHRKLLCHLVEELLNPYVEVTPYRRLPCAAADRWPTVVEKLCDEVKKLPRARCEVLEDIDGIIEKDMDILGIGFDEGIVKEIGEWILEEILNETVRFVEEVQDGVV